MFFNIIVNKENNVIIGVSEGFNADEIFLDVFYHGFEYCPIENTTTDYHSMIQTDFNLLGEFANGKQYKYVDNEVIEVSP